MVYHSIWIMCLPVCYCFWVKHWNILKWKKEYKKLHKFIACQRILPNFISQEKSAYVSLKVRDLNTANEILQSRHDSLCGKCTEKKKPSLWKTEQVEIQNRISWCVGGIYKYSGNIEINKAMETVSFTSQPIFKPCLKNSRGVKMIKTTLSIFINIQITKLMALPQKYSNF